MNPWTEIAPGDGELVRIVDAALAEAARKAGPWLVCRPGCTPCCIGPFLINPLDALRLRQGLVELASADPERAERVRERARQSVARISSTFPGDTTTGIVDESEEAMEAFADFAGDEPCPALDPATGYCDLYAARPMTCRTFGPPVRCHAPEPLSGGKAAAESVHQAEGLGVCELCFEGASAEEIAACEVEVDPDNSEGALVDEVERATGAHGNTIVAFALAF